MNPSVGRAGPLDRGERRTLLGLCVVAFVAAVIGIGTKSFWFDEGYSAELARQPLGTWWRLLFEQEGGALLHAVLLKPWLAVSDADVWLRGLSVPFAVGQVVVTFFLARRVIGSGAWAAALALAVNGAFVQYAQEGRAYAMASFFVLAAALAFLRAVERPEWSRLAAFAALAVLCPLAHLYTAPFVVAMALTLLAFGSRTQPWGRWIVTGCVIGLVWGLLAVAVLTAGSDAAQPSDDLADRITSLVYVPRQFLSPYWLAGWVVLLLVGLWLARLAPLVAAGLRSEQTLGAALPLVMVAVPLVVALVVPQIDLDTNRYLLPVLPFLLVMAIGGVAWLSELWPRVSGPVWGVGVAVVLLVSASGLWRWHREIEKMDARTWTATLAAEARLGDQVAFDDIYGRIVTEHYLHQGELEVDAAPLSVREPFGEYFWDPVRDAIGACLLDELDVEALVAGSAGRTWIVLAAPETCWSTDRVLQAIDRSGRTVERIDLDGPSTLLLVE